MDDHQLISLVEERPAIYDKTNVHYSNKTFLKILWKEIATELKSTVLSSQKRWRYLRDYFVRQLHVVQQNNSDSTGQQQPARKSIWPYYERLQFLVPFSSKRRDRSKIEQTSDQCDYVIQFLQSEENNSIHSVSSNHSISSKDELNYVQLLQYQQQQQPQQLSTIANNGLLPEIENQREEQIVVDVDQYGYEMDEVKSESNEIDVDRRENELRSSRSVATVSTKDSTSKNSRKRKRWEMYDELMEILKSKRHEDEFDEHEHFFKSLLASVRRIDDDHIMAFRTEIMQTVTKYLYASNGENTTDSERDRSDVVVIETGKKHWRRNLRRYSQRMF